MKLVQPFSFLYKERKTLAKKKGVSPLTGNFDPIRLLFGGEVNFT